MKALWIENARLLDPASDLDVIGSLQIADGLIEDFGPDLAPPANADMPVFKADGLCLAPGLIDLRVRTGEPGARHKETLATASAAAVAGGVTSMVVMPDTDPVIDDEALVEFILHQGRKCPNRIYPAGALTKGLAGKDMAEIGLMQEAGAVLFSNGAHSLANAGLMKRLLTYARDFKAKIYVRAEEASLIGSGVMNAGALAARMGLGGMGHEAEYIAGLRDIILAQATRASLILDQISTPELVHALVEAQRAGADVAATIAAHTLFFNELDVGDYLTHCKVRPPFRNEATRHLLIEAVRQGQIEAIVSAHDPQPEEDKRVPFSEAAFGAVGLETLFSSVLSLVQEGHLTLLEALRPLTIGPARLAGLEGGCLKRQAPADIILFDPDEPWVCNREALRSKSSNSPYHGRRLQGRVHKTFVQGEEVFSLR